ncbi:hypothetical protein IDJ75_17645 [Mucilaginibacter rigui]|uniref:PH domain-containing protein n=1 Tax=Mucilaginibacter rigui TaxID=534635 RepID=A0ABR7X958_9SPHI|nr:hypothetical protein [Mucilaginibacter rigui]MBD1387115.1 hypothetical protein [Mucilaginibacter rigui]
MSIKSLYKTRWKLDASKVTIYPHGSFYIMGVVLAVIFAAIIAVFINYERDTHQALYLGIFLSVIILLFILIGNTSVEFDNSKGIMSKKLMGLFPFRIIPFKKLHSINAVTNMGGGYNYRIYRKDNRYGKGIVVSSGYSKNTDANALAFVDEVIPLVHNFLDQHGALADEVKQPISTYKYFIPLGGQYTLKKNKIGGVILGLTLLAFGIHEVTPGAWIDYNGIIGKIFVLAFLFIGGAAILLSSFTDITIDTFAKTIERKSPINLGNKAYNLRDYTGIRTVRKTINLIYAGTEIYVSFISPTSGKEESLMLATLRRSRNIERFVEELNQIIAQ